MGGKHACLFFAPKGNTRPLLMLFSAQTLFERLFKTNAFNIRVVRCTEEKDKPMKNCLFTVMRGIELENHEKLNIEGQRGIETHFPWESSKGL